MATSRRGIHDGADRLFGSRVGAVEKLVDLLAREDQRQLLLHLRQLHFADRIMPQPFPSGEKLIESA